jgi:organic hydroperoxide reductase OsmC/OhrA
MLRPKEVVMSIVKLHRYGVRARSDGSPCLALEAPGKPPLRVASPPEFKGGIPGVWSPEELLIGALAACFERTVVAIAAYEGMPLHAVQVDATGHVLRKNGKYYFSLFELDVELETDTGREHEAERVAQLAHERCIVESALDVPVHLSVEARAASMTAVSV